MSLAQPLARGSYSRAVAVEWLHILWADHDLSPKIAPTRRGAMAWTSSLVRDVGERAVSGGGMCATSKQHASRAAASLRKFCRPPEAVEDRAQQSAERLRLACGAQARASNGRPAITIPLRQDAPLTSHPTSISTSIATSPAVPLPSIMR